MITAYAASAQEMQSLGKQLAKKLLPGDVLLLSGDMGAGKSEFCRGVARGLKIKGPVTSPTFTILNMYEEGSIPFHHFDFYRILGAEELLESGLDELIGGLSITAIEWHEKAPDLLPDDCLEIIIKQYDNELKREIRFLPHGAFRDLTDILEYRCDKKESI